MAMGGDGVGALGDAVLAVAASAVNGFGRFEAVGAAWDVFRTGVADMFVRRGAQLFGLWTDESTAGSGSAVVLDGSAVLFASICGAAAVAALLTTSAALRRLRRSEAERGRLEARLERDLSSERVFLATRAGLTPASAAADRAFAAATALDDAPFSRRFDALDDDDEPTFGGPTLRRIFGEEATRAIGVKILDLVRDGAPFDHRGQDADGAPTRFVGETRGAAAIVRLTPDTAGPSRSAEEGAGKRSAVPQITALAAALEHAPSGVAIFNGEHRLVSANAAARRLLALRPDWVSSGPSLRGVIDQLRDVGRAPQRPDHAAWRASLLQDPIAAFDREPLWALPSRDMLNVAATPLAGGGFVLFVNDETDAIRLERRFKGALQATRATVDAIDQGLVVIGQEGLVRMANPAFGALWGLEPGFGSPTDAERASLSQLARLAARDEHDRRIWADIVAALTGSGPRRAHEFSGKRADGRRLSIRATPLPDGAALLAMRDMTETDRAEAALRERGDALEAVDRLKTAFVNDVAHELRSPLSTVIGFTDMLRQGMAGPLTPRQLECLGYVLQASNALRELISDALDLGALEAGAMALERRPIAASALAQAAAASMAPRAEARRAQFSAPDPTAGSSVSVKADAGRLRAAIEALAGVVAGQAGPDDALALTVEAPREDGRVRLSATLERTRALSGEAGRSETNGVAATLATRMVEAHGGAAQLNVDAGGAALVIELPVYETAASPNGAASQPSGSARPRADVGRTAPTSELGALADAMRRGTAARGAP